MYRVWWQHSKHGAFTQCCFNVGPPSSTLAQHWNSIGWMSHVYWQCQCHKWTLTIMWTRMRVFIIHASNVHLIDQDPQRGLYVRVVSAWGGGGGFLDLDPGAFPRGREFWMYFWWFILAAEIIKTAQCWFICAPYEKPRQDWVESFLYCGPKHLGRSAWLM